MKRILLFLLSAAAYACTQAPAASDYAIVAGPGIADDPQRSVVMVTHDLEAASLADRVLVLKDGRVLRELGRSAPAEILEALEAAR